MAFKKSEVLFSGIFVVILCCLGISLVSRYGDDDRQSGNHHPQEFQKPALINPTEQQSVSNETSLTPAFVKETVAEIMLYGTVSSKSSQQVIPQASLELFSGPDPQQKQTTRKALTDEQGDYHFLLPKEEFSGGNVTLGVHAEGYAAQFIDLFIAKKRNKFKYDVELEAGMIVSGSVVNTNERPVEGATVGLYHQPLFNEFWTDTTKRCYPSVKTDAQGSFTLTGVPVVGEPVVIASADGYLPAHHQVQEGQANELKLVLAPGEAMVRGVVYHHDGTPAAHYPVIAKYLGQVNRSRPIRAHQEFSTINNVSTQTDENGFYELSTLASGQHFVFAGYEEPVKNFVRETINLGSGEEKTLNLRLPEKFVFQGVVIDSETQQPIPGVKVSNYNPKASFDLSQAEKQYGVKRSLMESDFEGKFSFELASGGGLTPHACETGFYYYVPEDYCLGEESWQYRRIGSRNLDELYKLKLDRVKEVEGIVYQSDHETPASGAKIYITDGHSLGVKNLEDYCVATTNDQGRFTCRSENKFRYITAIHPTGSACERLYYISPDMKRDFPLIRWDTKYSKDKEKSVLVIQPEGSISGRVVNGDGVPCPDVKVCMYFDTMIKMCGLAAQYPDETITTYTDEKGHYHFDRLHARNYTIQPIDSNDNRPEGQVVALSQGQKVEDLDFTLHDSTTFDGMVVDELGKPIQGVDVRAHITFKNSYYDSRTVQNVVTNHEGLFHFESLPTESRNLYFYFVHPLYDNVGDSYDLINSPIEVTMKQSPILEFTVLRQDGTQITDFRFDLVPSRLASNRISAHPQELKIHRYIYQQTEPVRETISRDEYLLQVYETDSQGNDTGLYGMRTIPFTEGELHYACEVILGDPLRVHGQVVAPDGRPVEGVELSLLRGGKDSVFDYSPSAVCHSIQNGDFAFPSIQSGTYKLKVDQAKMDDTELVLAEPPVFDLNTETSPVYLNIELTGGASIIGKVIDVDGSPKSGILVSINKDRSNTYDTTDESGSFSFQSLPFKTYRLTFKTRNNNVVLDTRDVEVNTNDDYEVTVDLTGKVWLETTLETTNIDQSVHLQFWPKDASNNYYQTIKEEKTSFKTLLAPGEYDVFAGNKWRKMFHTGETFVITEEPLEQNNHLSIPLETIDVLITFEDGKFTSGKLTYYHESTSGFIDSQTLPLDSSTYSFKHQPHGRCRAEFIADDGREFASDGWIEINEASDKILTLIPKDLVEEK